MRDFKVLSLKFSPTLSIVRPLSTATELLRTGLGGRNIPILTLNNKRGHWGHWGLYEGRGCLLPHLHTAECLHSRVRQTGRSSECFGR